jgi:hypothetical protein
MSSHCLYTAQTFLEHLLFKGAIAKLRKATISFDMSVRPYVCLAAWNNSTGWILMKFDIWQFFKNLSRKFIFD